MKFNYFNENFGYFNSFPVLGASLSRTVSIYQTWNITNFLNFGMLISQICFKFIFLIIVVFYISKTKIVILKQNFLKILVKKKTSKL